MLLIAIAVVGGIYGGVFTPTEGAAVGVVAVLVLGLATRTLGVRRHRREPAPDRGDDGDDLHRPAWARRCSTRSWRSPSCPSCLAESITDAELPPHAVLAGLLLFYIVLGGVMDELAMLLLTLPVFFPVVMGLDFGLDSEETAIWFGILVLVIVGIGLTAPPIGLNVFVMKAIAGRTPITTIYRGVLPFLASDLVRLVLLVAFPGLSLALVRVADLTAGGRGTMRTQVGIVGAGPAGCSWRGCCSCAGSNWSSSSAARERRSRPRSGPACSSRAPSTC